MNIVWAKNDILYHQHILDTRFSSHKTMSTRHRGTCWSCTCMNSVQQKSLQSLSVCHFLYDTLSHHQPVSSLSSSAHCLTPPSPGWPDANLRLFPTRWLIHHYIIAALPLMHPDVTPMHTTSGAISVFAQAPSFLLSLAILHTHLSLQQLPVNMFLFLVFPYVFKSFFCVMVVVGRFIILYWGLTDWSHDKKYHLRPYYNVILGNCSFISWFWVCTHWTAW